VIVTPLYKRHKLPEGRFDLPCRGDFRRAYIRRVETYGERPKWVAFGWYCDKCHVTVTDAQLEEEMEAEAHDD
jgi:hypothetical protein